MGCLAVNKGLIAVAKGLHIDVYNFEKHVILKIPCNLNLQENDYICDLEFSSDSKNLALITSSSKKLYVYDIPAFSVLREINLTRSASKIRFSADNSCILVADKSGDVFQYNIKCEGSGTQLLGHLSLLLDVLQTSDKKYIATSDRDEKIRISFYPNTYNISTYCLGHTEFVNHIEELPHSNKYLTSSSGDGTIKCWEINSGKNHYTIDTAIDVDKNQLKENFIQSMDKEGIEVKTLPIVHYTVTSINDKCTLVAATVHTYNSILIYSMTNENEKFCHKLEQKIVLDKFPSNMKFLGKYLFVYYSSDCKVTEYIVSRDNNITLNISKEIETFSDQKLNVNSKESKNNESIKVLYKRKFDNVQEYQERKKQRLQKT